MISKDEKFEIASNKMITARPWKSRHLSNTRVEDEGSNTWSEQGSKSCQDKPSSRDHGWGLSILKQQQQQQNKTDAGSRLHKGSFVDLIGAAGLARLALRDEDVEQSSSRGSASVTSGSSSLHSSTQRTPETGRASSRASSSGRSSDNIDAFFQEVDDMSERPTSVVAKAAYKRGLSQRRIRGSSSSSDTPGGDEAKSLGSEDNKEEQEDTKHSKEHKIQKKRSSSRTSDPPQPQELERMLQAVVQAQNPVAELFHAVKTKDEASVKSLISSSGLSLESTDRNGMTPLIVSCLDTSLLQMARLLISLGANIHGYRPGLHAGYPLHHAAKRGHEQTVALLLSSGASALAVNDDGQTALDMARIRGHASVVRVIEDWISLFRGILRQVTDNAGSQIMKRIWAVVLPSEAASGGAPRHELVIYNSRKVPMPESVILLGSVTSEFEEPDYALSDPSLIITDKVTKTKFKFFSQEHGDKKQLAAFFGACKGVRQRDGQPSKRSEALSRTKSETPSKDWHSKERDVAAPPLSRSRSEKVSGSRKNVIYPEESLRPDEHQHKSEPKRQGGSQCVLCKHAAAPATKTCGHVCSSPPCLSQVKGGLCPACRAR